MKVEINFYDDSYEVVPGLVKGSELYTLSKTDQTKQLLFEVEGDIDIPVGWNDYIILTGNERFSIGDNDPPILDNPCLRNPISIEFNGIQLSDDQVFQHPKVLGTEIKQLDVHGEASDGLFVDLSGLADEPIRDDQRVILRPDMSFITTPCGNVGYESRPDGIVGVHFDLVLAEYDQVSWHMHPAGSAIVIGDFLLPPHWSEEKVDLMIIVPNGYPISKLDMFYVSPKITLEGGLIPDRGNTFESHLGREWQRFSWHYQSRPWSPTKDSFLSHVKFCNRRLKMAN